MEIDLTLVLCTYNEISRVDKAYQSLLQSMEKRKENVEILFIDNCSTDGTREWLSNQKHSSVKVFLNESNLGKGGSIKRGIKEAKGKYFVIFDPDLEYSVEDVWKCFDYIKMTNIPCVLGSRIKDQTPNFYYHLNILGVKLLSYIISTLYKSKITDAATGMKIFRTDLLKKVHFKCNGFDLDFELITKLMRSGNQIEEIPISYHPRTIEEGKKIRPFVDGFKALKIILLDRLYFGKFKNES
jgi:dolichol-phosphate mannosyltransferase